VAPSRVPRLAGSAGERAEGIAEKAGFELAGVAPGTVPRGIDEGCHGSWVLAEKGLIRLPKREAFKLAVVAPETVPCGTDDGCYAYIQ
jgi:hypothetical protein